MFISIKCNKNRTNLSDNLIQMQSYKQTNYMKFK